MLADGFRYAKIDHLRHRIAIAERHQHVAWFDVPVDDSLLMRMLDGLAHWNKQFQSLLNRKALLIAVLGNGNALHEIGPLRFSRARIEHARDIRMLHQRQRLTFGIKPRQHIGRVHSWFDKLDSHHSAHRLHLLCHPHASHSAFTHGLQQLVWTDE